MKVLIVGQGGREHALCWKISQSSKVDKIYAIPGNGGIGKLAENVNISAEDIENIVKFAEDKKIDLTVIGPETPLALGIVDKFTQRKLLAFGPDRACSQLESSKVFAKEFMRKYLVPTAEFEVFDKPDEAKDYLRNKTYPIVIKADGLCAGKGSIIAKTYTEAVEVVANIMEKKIFGKAGNKIIIEEFIEGEEASLLVFTDGETILPLVSSQDHKRIYDNDQGANTGGMGAYSPALVVTDSLLKSVLDKVIKPVIFGLKNEGYLYKGVLYAGLMIKDGEIFNLEFNVRFGDPEIQAIIPKMKNDLIEVMDAVINQRLNQLELRWDNRFCVCVVCASGGYPDKFEKGKIIQGLEKVESLEDVIVFHSGTKVKKPETSNQKPEKNIYVTNGGRVLGVTALGETIKQAIDSVYNAISFIHFDRMHYRKDIGYRALDRQVTE